VLIDASTVVSHAPPRPLVLLSLLPVVVVIWSPRMLVVVVRGKVEPRELTGYGISSATARGYLANYLVQVYMDW
jgi:hypothetical protein